MSVATHAADAAALLDRLGISRAHIAGHSSGAAVAAQLALDHPETVHTLILLELSLFSVPSGEAFLQQAGPAFEAYGSGHHERALALFMSFVSGLDWATCGSCSTSGYLAHWRRRSRTSTPVLSVRGADTRQLWVEVADFLRSSLPQVEESTIDDVGHLLHIQNPRPVARAMAQFLASHCIAGY